jgi:hypothetical protein
MPPTPRCAAPQNAVLVALHLPIRAGGDPYLDPALRLLETGYDLHLDAGVDDPVWAPWSSSYGSPPPPVGPSERRFEALRQALRMRYDLRGKPDDLVEAIDSATRRASRSR